MLRDDLLKMMENFISRAPRMQVTDVKARVAACDRIRVRVQELAVKRGMRFLRGLFRKMITETAEGARARIRSWNDGIYRHVVFIDTTGFDAALIRTPVALIKRGDHIVIDLTGASPEHEGASRRSLRRCGPTAPCTSTSFHSTISRSRRGCSSRSTSRSSTGPCSTPTRRPRSPARR